MKVLAGKLPQVENVGNFLNFPPEEAAWRSHRERLNREECLLFVELPLAVCSLHPPFLDLTAEEEEEEEAMITFLHF